MKDWITKNWKTCLIVLLALFCLSKCTQSCNRKSDVKQLTYQLDSLTDVVDAQALMIHDYQKDLGWMNENKKDISNVASANQASYIEAITKLRDENADLKSQVSKLKRDTMLMSTQLRNRNSEIAKLKEAEKH